MPAHNSALVIERTVERLRGRLADRPAEIIVVENGSTDDTWDRCERIAQTWYSKDLSFVGLRSAKGIGNAYKLGAQHSRGQRVLLTADDLPFGFDDLDAADRLASEGRDLPPVIIGSKAHRDSVVERGKQRRYLAGGFGLLRRLILTTHVGDSQGTFIVDGELLRRLAPHVSEGGFLFTTELVLLAEQAGIRPLEVAVRLSADHHDHPSRVSARDIGSMALGVLRLRLRHLRRRTP